VSRSDRDRLLDIVEAVAAIHSHLERGELSDGLIFDAIRARLMEIGEAVKDIGGDARAPTDRCARGWPFGRVKSGRTADPRPLPNSVQAAKDISPRRPPRMYTPYRYRTARLTALAAAALVGTLGVGTAVGMQISGGGSSVAAQVPSIAVTAAATPDPSAAPTITATPSADATAPPTNPPTASPKPTSTSQSETDAQVAARLAEERAAAQHAAAVKAAQKKVDAARVDYDAAKAKAADAEAAVLDAQRADCRAHPVQTPQTPPTPPASGGTQEGCTVNPDGSVTWSGDRHDSAETQDAVQAYELASSQKSAALNKLKQAKATLAAVKAGAQ
jgi:hypothetical protein